MVSKYGATQWPLFFTVSLCVAATDANTLVLFDNVSIADRTEEPGITV